MTPARVAGLGAVTPVGLSAPATFAALRAGIARITEIGSFAVAGVATNTQPLMGGRVPLELFENLPEGEVTEYPGHQRFERPIPPPLASFTEDGPDRLVRMLAPALEEAIIDAGWGPSTSGIDLWIAVDPSDADEATARAIREACERVLVAQAVPLLNIEVTPSGRAGALAFVEGATRALAKTGARRGILAGVGSLIRPREAARLEAFGNLRSADRPLGIYPGECAAAVAIERAGETNGRRSALLVSARTTHEPAARGEPCDAHALSSALTSALEGAGGLASRPLVVCDLNGDRYRGIEWGIALVRALGAIHGDNDVWHPADAIGDAGAGLGALTLAWAAHAMEADQGGSDRILVWGASDDGLRAACVVTTDTAADQAPRAQGS